MAIHLILLSVNEVNQDLTGSVEIFSNCLGALDKGRNLPPPGIPSRCSHSDVLKNILVNCSGLTFNRYYSHVSSHQDDTQEYRALTRPSQLNCTMDCMAKKALWDLQVTQLPAQQAFLLKPICIFAGPTNITVDMGDYIWFGAHKKLARYNFHHLKVLGNDVWYVT
jgi:hypothetical protein